MDKRLYVELPPFTGLLRIFIKHTAVGVRIIRKNL